MILRQRVNDAAKAVMLAYSTGEDLDQLGANFNTPRLVVAPADESTIRRHRQSWKRTKITACACRMLSKA